MLKNYSFYHRINLAINGIHSCQMDMQKNHLYYHLAKFKTNWLVELPKANSQKIILSPHSKMQNKMAHLVVKSKCKK